MKSIPPLKRSRTQLKEENNAQFDLYRPRDWDYQNPKHQIRPEFVLGKSKRRLPEPHHNYFPNDPKIYSPINNGWRRELKPAIFRNYILSQASTVPGAVIVEETKIKDDKTQADRRKYVEMKNEELIQKLMNCDLNIDLLLEDTKNKKLSRAKTQENTFKGNILKPEINKNEKKKDDKKEEKVEKIKVNLRLSPRKRGNRNKKLGGIKISKN